MITIPQRLLPLPQVEILFSAPPSYILRKVLTQAVYERQSYISTHAISLVLQGTQKVSTYEEKRYTLTNSHIGFFPKGIYSLSDLLPAGSYFESIILFLDQSIIDEWLSKHPPSSSEKEEPEGFRVFSRSPAIQTYAEGILALAQHLTSSSEELIRVKLLELLHLLAVQEGKDTLTTYLQHISTGQKRSLRNFMEQNYDKPLSVTDFAYLTGRSLSSFRRDFKRQFQTTPQQWLKDHRLQKAHGKLISLNMNVSEVAVDVGYEHTSYFIKAFREKYGCTPNELIKETRQNVLR